jgi:hypothetical protein
MKHKLLAVVYLIPFLIVLTYCIGGILDYYTITELALQFIGALVVGVLIFGTLALFIHGIKTLIKNK